MNTTVTALLIIALVLGVIASNLMALKYLARYQAKQDRKKAADNRATFHQDTEASERD